MNYAKKKIEEVGINPERLEMYHIGASEGPLFARSAKEFTERIRKIMIGEKRSVNSKQ